MKKLQKQLEKILLDLNGNSVKFGIDTKQELQQMIDNGRFKNTDGLKVYKTGMLPNQCHRNSVVLKLKKKSYQIFTGYALTDENVWLQHTWCANSFTNIVETTQPFRRYYGYQLKGEELLTFINENY